MNNLDQIIRENEAALQDLKQYRVDVESLKEQKLQQRQMRRETRCPPNSANTRYLNTENKLYTLAGNNSRLDIFKIRQQPVTFCIGKF